jgi:hypothetical protein
MLVGNKLLDFTWKLDLQVACESGKTNIPRVTLQLESLRNSEIQIEKVQMKGEQFLALFGNLRKIKENLLELAQKTED